MGLSTALLIGAALLFVGGVMLILSAGRQADDDSTRVAKNEGLE